MKKYKKELSVILFCILAVLPIVSLFHPGLPITHDGQDHVARIANFYQNLTEGNFVPGWAANLNWGYGHPILEFLYPLPSYIASFFHFTGFSLVNSTKIVYALGMVLSLFFMYLWLSQFSSKYAALFGAVLYTYAPYRFVEVYVRGDLGENLAFAFIPLTLFFIYKLYKKQTYNLMFLGGVSLALLILAHNAISLMAMPFVLVYCGMLLYLSKNRVRLALWFTLLIASGFLLSAFFWVPALLEGKYTLRDIVTKGGYLGSFVTLPGIIYGPWNYGITGQFTVQYGLFQWISIFCSPFVIYFSRKKREKYLLLIILLLFIIASTFLMFPQSNFIWSKVMLLQNFQFPWRFLALIVFLTAVLGSLVFDLIPKKYGSIMLVVFLLVILVISSFYWKPKSYQYKPESFYTGIYDSTTDTGESAPIWSVRFMEHAPKAPIQVVDGTGAAKQLKKTSTYRDFRIVAKTNVRILINLLYFPNWTVYANGRPVPIQFQDPRYRGLITFYLPAGNYNVEAIFYDTKLRMAAKLISIVTAFVFALFFIIRALKVTYN